LAGPLRIIHGEGGRGTAPDRGAGPVIGVTASEDDAPAGEAARRVVTVPLAYVSAIERAGGVALVLPAQSTGTEALTAILDGLVLSGGPDVAPDHYGALSHPRTQRPHVARDDFELALVRLAGEADLPLLAICRGVQVLNVARGGTLHQHLPDVVGHEGHATPPGEYAPHSVEIRRQSRLGAIQPSRLDVPSHHHQAIARVGRGLDVVALAEDGTIEAVEDAGRAFLIGVQWHPEVSGDDSLFEGLVEAAKARRES
jgi:gamma-glutamyl-gamma-aminobutyrate hydrolase PuuD